MRSRCQDRIRSTSHCRSVEILVIKAAAILLSRLIAVKWRARPALVSNRVGQIGKVRVNAENTLTRATLGFVALSRLLFQSCAQRMQAVQTKWNVNRDGFVNKRAQLRCERAEFCSGVWECVYVGSPARRCVFVRENLALCVWSNAAFVWQMDKSLSRRSKNAFHFVLPHGVRGFTRFSPFCMVKPDKPKSPTRSSFCADAQSGKAAFAAWSENKKWHF